ncbi:hypothetical protein FHQ18_00390 [Deferribacter autotrophicus]|uniref:Uncharacterized protein n=1 Tax=Deferribacter autotrophicus TaxID=500465 RepID=A0A5A8F7H8_9BACT|nr:hypothetical protein [Deferribacter autotrophicus]KAA0259369.1 hypothetical protein FHQ18_00390 [Deferribacter autotrophicus]
MGELTNKVVKETELKKECKYFESCNAPLCPLLSDDVNSLGLWYADEDICKLKIKQPYWVKKQQKIQHIHKHQKPVFGYFNFQMLNHSFRVQRGIIGLDPDKNTDSELQMWFKKYKGKSRLEAVSKQAS